jgi:hypothetical protein
MLLAFEKRLICIPLKIVNAEKMYSRTKIASSCVLPIASQLAFAYLSNLENDYLWRREINHTTLLGPPGLGVEAHEYSNLSKRMNNHLLVLICVEWSESEKVVFETKPDSPFYLKSIRRIEAIANNQSRFHYTIEFDNNLVKHALGFALPRFLIRFGASQDMKKYLNKLKEVVSNG